MTARKSTRPILAIGDVHGCADELRELLRVARPPAGTTIVFLGDYIDRGPNSRGVVETILELRKRHEVVTLQGNHEAMLLEFLDGTDPLKVARFIMNGGSASLASYSNGPGTYELPGEHVDFFNSLRLTYQTDTHFFVHAGVPDGPLAELDIEANARELLWTRKVSSFQWEKVIVHGHSAVREVEVASNRINLDTGCVYNRMLSAMEFPSYRVHSVARAVPNATAHLSDGSRRASVRFRGEIPVSLDVHGTLADFVTVDYSELGLAVKAPPGDVTSTLRIGDTVSGRIGPSNLFQVPFAGQVVRATWEGGEVCYGIAIERHGDPVDPVDPVDAVDAVDEP